MPIELIDSHAHLDFEDFAADFKGMLSRAAQAGVVGLVSIGSSTSFESAERAIKLAEQYPNIWASAGIHPHAAATEFDPEKLKAFCKHPRVVAVGETGLDFFREWSPREDQERWFRAQIEIAKEVKKPLIIHSREAGQQSLKILKELHADDIGGVYHCFSENDEFAKALKDINFLVSFPGTITFKKNDTLREIVRKIPLEQIMVETDAPYMAPEPNRGKTCESAFVADTAKMVAKIKGMPFEECAKILTATTKRFFSI
ncbi:MAG: TatD family hydrolase [bacterium]|nr:TatD family hydrolase [bacterium]